VFCDADQYREEVRSCADEPAQVPYLNKRYVLGGIYSTLAAHAKLILLTNGESGRLLVGSGNLNMNGYSSKGEMFCIYEYTHGDEGHLNSFIAVKEYVDAIQERGLLADYCYGSLQAMWSGVTWLLKSYDDGPRLVRHNLSETFLEQLSAEIASDTVEELIAYAPFYDEKAIALQRILGAAQPKKVKVLVQRNATSVDPLALLHVLEEFPCRFTIEECTIGKGNPYLHAKFILVKTSDRAICLQGSPNLSTAAMLLSSHHGNLELANLLVGETDAFDGILDSLDCTEASSSIDELGLAFRGNGFKSAGRPLGWVLAGGEWNEGALRLNIMGRFEKPTRMLLIINQEEFLIDAKELGNGLYESPIPKDAIPLLSEGLPSASDALLAIPSLTQVLSS